MKLKISREAKIGALVLVTLAIGFWGFNYLKGLDIFVKQRTYFAVYKEVSGLNVNSPVEMNGFPVGSVTSIKLMTDRPGFVLVSFRISNSDLVIPSDSEAKIESSSLLGSKHIRILLGASGDAAAPGDTLKSGVGESLQESFNNVVVPLKAKVENLISSIDSILTPIQAVLSPKTVSSISDAIQTIPDIINNIKSATSRIDGLVESERDKLSRILSNVESLSANLKNNNERITNILTNLDTVSSNLAQSNFKQTIQKATDVLAEVDQVVKKINSGQGTLGLLVNDKKLYTDLEGAVTDVRSLIQDLEANPERYIHLSLIHVNKKVTPPKEKKPKPEN